MAIAFQLPKQGETGWTAELIWRYVQVPLVGALRYGPSALLALAAAYASAQWAQHNTIFPPILAWTIGIAFEWLYLGSLAMSSALRNSKYFKPVNIGGMTVSIIYGTLYAADKYGVLAPITAAFPALLGIFAILHAAPLAGMNYLYNNLIHEYHAEQRNAADEQRYECSCGGWHGKSIQAFHGHKRGGCGGSLIDTQA
jgi:hypothetical protein